MSIINSFVVNIEAVFTPEEITKIFSRGENHGCKYFSETIDLNINLNNSISTQEAIRLLFSKEPRLDDEIFPGILIYNDGTYFFLYFEKIDDYRLKVDLTLSRYPWERAFYGLEYIDFNRYIRLLLDMTYDFPLVDIRVEQI